MVLRRGLEAAGSVDDDANDDGIRYSRSSHLSRSVEVMVVPPLCSNGVYDGVRNNTNMLQMPFYVGYLSKHWLLIHWVSFFKAQNTN